MTVNKSILCPRMNKAIVFVLLQTIWTTGFAESLRFKEFGTPIPARADLDVRWNAPAKAFPPSLWVYHLLPVEFSPAVISNLMVIGSFTEKDRINAGPDGIRFRSSDKTRRLSISCSLGAIAYDVDTHYGPTNLAEKVPDGQEAVRLTKNLLPKLGLKLSDIDKKDDGPGAAFHVLDSETVYFVNHTFITNIQRRSVCFRRAVDGLSFLGAGTGGNGKITFGDYGKIINIDLSWRNLQRSKSYATVTPDTIMNAIRKGKAVQGWLLANSPGIDWPVVKSVTIKGAWPCYDAGNPLHRSDWLYPFVALDTTVDTGQININVEIDCPIIDETKPALVGK